MNQRPESQTTHTMNEPEVRSCQVPEELRDEVQTTHISFDAQMEVVCSMLEQHAKDLTGDVINSTIFRAYLQMTADSMKDWLDAKQQMLEAVFGDTLEDVAEWSLDYESSLLTYTMHTGKVSHSTAQACKEISESTVFKIQSAHVLYDCMNAVISLMMEKHCNDTVDIITPSLTFKEFSKMHAEAKLNWEKAKKDMLLEAFGMEGANKIVDWNLDYATRLLKYTK